MKCDIGMVGADAKILTLRLEVIRSKLEKSQYWKLLSSRMQELGIWSTYPTYWAFSFACFILLVI